MGETFLTMDLHDAQIWLQHLAEALSQLLQKIRGSPVLLRYIHSSYQNDPVRSVIELLLCIFAARYLLAPAYSTQKKDHVRLTEEVSPTISEGRQGLGGWMLISAQEVDELVDDWTPEPLVAPLTPFQETENEKRPVIVGYANSSVCKARQSRPR